MIFSYVSRFKNNNCFLFTTVTFSREAFTGFSDYIRTQHRAIASGNGITYEQLTGDYSNVNFSSGRMGWIEFQRNVDDWQWMVLIPHFCDKAYLWFIDALKIAQGLSKDTQVSVTWTAPRREMIDPVKEIAAMKTLVRAGFSSWQEVVKQQGYLPEDILRELQEDQKKFKDAGLYAEWSPGLDPATSAFMHKQSVAQ